jgi:hypothetical protein
MDHCYICNRPVLIIEEKNLSEYEERIFSCGHASKHFKRNIIENVEITPKTGEKIPVTISGISPAIHGELHNLTYQIEENKPIQLNVNITNIIPNITDLKLTQNIAQTSNINNILTILNQSSLSTDVKVQIENLIKDFDNESKLPKSDGGKLKSILSKIFPLSKDIGLMLLKHALDNGLLSGSSLFR